MPRDQLMTAAPADLGRVAFAMLAGPIAWAVHFMGSYALVTLDCTTGWDGARIAIAVATLLLAAVSLAAAVVGYRGWRERSAEQPWDAALAEPRGWVPFLMTSGAVLGLLSALTILLQGLSAVLVPVCSESGVIS